MTGRDDPADRVDALVAGIGPRLGAPSMSRRDVVLVTGPWMAGVSGIVAALRDRLPQHKFVESTDLGPGEAPLAIVFVVSAATPLTESDCALLDAAADNTDVVVGVVSKIDVHRNWRDVLESSRERLAAHAPRYAEVPWVGGAALPELGDPRLDDLVDTVSGQLADSGIGRRNRLRAWESRLEMVAQRFDRDAEGAGRRVRVDALREDRSTALRERRQSKSERTISLRGQVQQARVQLSHFARNRCSAVRGELQADAAGLSRKKMADFEAYTRGRAAEVVTEVGDGADKQLAEVAEVMGVPMHLPAVNRLPVVDAPPPPMKSRRQETLLMVLLGGGFGLGVAIALSRLLANVAPGLKIAGGAACVVIGLAVTVLVVHIRGLLRDRAMLDRWAGDVIGALRSTVEELVSTRVLTAETVLTSALAAREEAENTRVSDQVGAIDSELREHAIAAARAAAVRDREMPTVRAALEAVRAELGDPGAPADGSRGAAEDTDEGDGTEKSASTSGDDAEK